jgi:hypothetical protein
VAIRTQRRPAHTLPVSRLDVAQVSRILGHARPSITLDTYTHLFDQAAHAADIRDRLARSQFGISLRTRQLAKQPASQPAAEQSARRGTEPIDGASPSEG